MEEEETKKIMCATWKDIPCTLWQEMMEDSMKNMKNSDLISDLRKIWHEKDKNIHEEVEFGIYMQPLELGKELEHEEEDKCHESY